MKAVTSLAYLQWVPAGDSGRSGVTFHERETTSPGWNIYASYDKRTFYLMDMDGKILHQWSDGRSNLSHGKLLANGDLIGMHEDHFLFGMDRASKVRWVNRRSFHHDFSLTPRGEILALTRKEGIAFRKFEPISIINDGVATLTANGRILKEISLYTILKENGLYRTEGENFWSFFIRELTRLNPDFLFSRKLYLPLRLPQDIFHTNTLNFLDRDIPGFCRKGDWLLSFKNLDMVAVLDPENEKIRWSWGPGELQKPHYPDLLENGRLLIFDNGSERHYSRVIELDPLTKKIVWQYVGTPPKSFFSDSRGSAQRLPNGNTLITESDKGHAFEVTASGKTVWEFYMPMQEKDPQKRESVYRVLRLPESEELAARLRKD